MLPGRNNHFARLSCRVRAEGPLRRSEGGATVFAGFAGKKRDKSAHDFERMNRGTLLGARSTRFHTISCKEKRSRRMLPAAFV